MYKLNKADMIVFLFIFLFLLLVLFLLINQKTIMEKNIYQFSLKEKK